MDTRNGTIYDNRELAEAAGVPDDDLVTGSREALEKLRKKIVFSGGSFKTLAEANDSSSQRRTPIDKPYAYHKPSPSGLDKINALREHFSAGERLIRELCVDHEGKPTRQQSIAITNNEQTAMWAIKAVVFNDPASVPEVPQPATA